MVYHGTGSGITVYQDGIRVVRSTAKQGGGSMPSGDGHVFIGRRNLGSQGVRYASTYVDELKMYNRQLSEAEICKMY